MANKKGVFERHWRHDEKSGWDCTYRKCFIGWKRELWRNKEAPQRIGTPASQNKQHTDMKWIIYHCKDHTLKDWRCYLRLCFCTHWKFWIAFCTPKALNKTALVNLAQHAQGKLWWIIVLCQQPEYRFPMLLKRKGYGFMKHKK